MQWLVDLFTHVRVSSLGQDAVIEIMIALLGAMIAVLTLVAGLVTILIAVAAFFGYSSLKDNVVQAAVQRADEVAIKVAKESARKILVEGRLQEQASSILQSIPPPARRKASNPSTKLTTRMKDDADLKLRKGEEDDGKGRRNRKKQPD